MSASIADAFITRAHLKHALSLATRSQDNYLRAIVLALISAHYFHTAGDHALSMLQTCEQLAAGLGAPAKKSTNDDAAAPASVAVGNARLGLWVGQKFLGMSSNLMHQSPTVSNIKPLAIPELYKRAGKEHRIQRQLITNQRLEEAVGALSARCVGS